MGAAHPARLCSDTLSARRILREVGAPALEAAKKALVALLFRTGGFEAVRTRKASPRRA